MLIGVLSAWLCSNLLVQASVILHNGGSVLAADSVLASHIGNVNSFLANTSACQAENAAACFACVPLPKGGCLPIVYGNFDI